MEEKFRGWNRAMVGAYKRGQEACTRAWNTGEVIECPYEDIRKGTGQVTWSRSFIKGWEDGYRDRDMELTAARLNGSRSPAPFAR